MDYKTNNLWLMQGDCLERMKEIETGSVDMILCDLPYGTTQNKWDSVIPFTPLWEQYKRVIKKQGAIVLTASQPFTSALVMSNVKMFKYEWIWEKSQAVGHLNAWKRPMLKHESILVFANGQTQYNPMIEDKPVENQRPLTTRTKKSTNYGDHRLDTHKCPPDKSMPRSVVKFNNAQGNIHPTQKPLSLMEYLIKTYTNESETVLDNCFGSGTTGVACVNTNRKFIGIELDENYYGLAKKRIIDTIR